MQNPQPLYFSSPLWVLAGTEQKMRVFLKLSLSRVRRRSPLYTHW
jgi:hypothetical protein